MNGFTIDNHLDEFMNSLKECALCPHECHANRLEGETGFCAVDASFNIASICIHRGEEPAISGNDGICNIFFTNCNLQCIYCQNHQISNNQCLRSLTRLEPGEVAEQIISILKQGINHVGFVSPSHVIPQVKSIIHLIEKQGYKPIWVYNSNGYDKVETLKSLEGIIDVYLPDFKYSDATLGMTFSGVPDYPSTALNALKEMFRQKGSYLHSGDDGKATSGIIVRHLVLPGHSENSLGVIRLLAEELSPRIHLSLMAQYFPSAKALGHPELGRTISREEYQLVTDEMEVLGMFNGWVQEFESSNFYRPDFTSDHPFENQS
jgi:putative pyruvate formate lyase activating enzyme